MMKNISVIVATMVLFLSFGANSAALSTGPWRFELKTTNGIVPFIIEFKLVKKKYYGTLHNGKETIKLNDIRIKDKNVSIPLQLYQSSLEMEQPKEGKMTGLLIRHNKNPKVEQPVLAVHDEKERFPEEKSKPTIDLNGRWAVTLTDEADKKDSGVIVFEQKGNELHGSILTPTGDYRYMEGFVSNSEFEAASFDGVYNYLVRGTVNKDGKLEAKILTNTITKIEGTKDDKAELPDAYKQTQVESIDFTFPDLKGKKVSLKDKKFKNKPVIIQFFGSWCPNCLDEMDYLIPWYKENKNRGIEIVALAFERGLSVADGKKQLVKFQKKKKIPYTVLLAGTTAEDKPMEKIPGLKNFISFPTTVFLNKKHEVVKVHAGFTGPSTGEFYVKWKTEFNQSVNEILK